MSSNAGSETAWTPRLCSRPMEERTRTQATGDAVEGTDRLPRQDLSSPLSEPSRLPRRILTSSVERRIPMRIPVRRLLLGAMVTGSLVVLPGPASAHVHGITPLLQCSVVPAKAGATKTDSTPAAAA